MRCMGFLTDEKLAQEAARYRGVGPSASRLAQWRIGSNESGPGARSGQKLDTQTSLSRLFGV